MYKLSIETGFHNRLRNNEMDNKRDGIITLDALDSVTEDKGESHRPGYGPTQEA